MKIFRLTKKDRELFLDMDPLYMMDRLELPGAFALAAVVEQKETGEELPAGLAICMDTGNSMIVQWLCVAVKYRKQGIGEGLLAAVFDAAVQLKYSSVCAYINTEYGRDIICPEEEKYLRDRLFTETRPLAGEWITNIRSLRDVILTGSAKTANAKVIPLKALPLGQRRDALHLLSKKKYMASLYSVEDNMQYLDMDISCLLYENGELTGGLLVQSVERVATQLCGGTVQKYMENVIYPICMCIESSKGIKALLTTVLEEAVEKYNADSEVHIWMNKGYYAPLMERIHPNSRIDSKLLAASVEDYQKQDVEYELQLLLSIV